MVLGVLGKVHADEKRLFTGCGCVCMWYSESQQLSLPMWRGDVKLRVTAKNNGKLLGSWQSNIDEAVLENSLLFFY